MAIATEVGTAAIFRAISPVIRLQFWNGTMPLDALKRKLYTRTIVSCTMTGRVVSLHCGGCQVACAIDTGELLLREVALKLLLSLLNSTRVMIVLVVLLIIWATHRVH